MSSVYSVSVSASPGSSSAPERSMSKDAVNTTSTRAETRLVLAYSSSSGVLRPVEYNTDEHLESNHDQADHLVILTRGVL